MPDSRDLKEKAGLLIDKLIDVYQGSKTKPSSPPDNPPPWPPKPPGGLSPSVQGNNLTASFNALSISGPSSPAAHYDSDFVGGFNLAGASTSSLALSSASRPPAMPMPYAPAPDKQSLTMQMAMRPEYDTFGSISAPPAKLSPTQSSRPQSISALSLPKPSSTTGLSPPVTPARPSSTPLKTKVSSDSSTSQPSTPSGKTGQVQCAGITKAGKQCTRQVKAELACDDDEDEEELVPRFCFQHTAEVLSPSGYYARQNGVWVRFDDWIPPYLQPSTQASLRAEMEKAKSRRDVPGYIYTFEIRDPGKPRTIKLKVGRAVNLVKRIDQWGKQCGSKEQVLRGFYPGNVEEDESSLMKGRVQAGEKAAWCHRLERLVHIELADLVSTSVYLEPGWPRIGAPAASSASKSKTNGAGNAAKRPCADCGSMHKEIFEFRRWEKGKFKGKEWEQVVKPVVERWGRFVELYL